MTLDEFLARPTREAWVAELALGWTGPDGSSCSPDNIMGIRIGITSPDWLHVDLAANRHDWLYQLGRRLGLGPEFRKAADLFYRDRCIAITDGALIGWRRHVARWRARRRYWALRLLGWVAFRE